MKMALAAIDGETLVCSILCAAYSNYPCVSYCRSPSHSYDVTIHTNLHTALDAVWQLRSDRGSTVVKVLVRSQLVSLEFFIDINPSDRTMALGSTQPLTEMSTRSISWG